MEQPHIPTPVLVGTDWWTDCDDAVAMRVLAWAQRQQKIQLLGIGINACMPDSARSLSAFLQHEGLCVPLGLDARATDFGGNPPYQKNLTKLPGYCPNNDACEDAAALYRRLLAAARQPVDVIEIGYPQVLQQLLQSVPDEVSSLTGMQLVQNKVRRLWMMAGKWDEPCGKENNFARNARSAAAGQDICALWPTPITFLGWEVSFKIRTGGNLPEGDVLRDILRDHGSENGRSSWDPMLMLLACTGDETAAGYRTVRGFARVDAQTGENTFTPDPAGRHAYVVKAKEDSFYREAIDGILAMGAGRE